MKPREESVFSNRKAFGLLLFILWLLAGASAGLATITAGGPLKVRILYDNSGSMYPGYTPEHPGRAPGVKYFHQYPDFQQWMGDLVANQTILDGGTVSMWTFTSQGAFTPGDLKEVHREVPIAEFDIARAVGNFPRKAGQTTYLKESLDQVTRGFEGLVWLVTDNVVDVKVGDPIADVERFFEALKGESKYHSVQLFKYPFTDERAGKGSVLAVYGILVSATEVPDGVLVYYDRKFRDNFRFANRRQGDPPPQLFPGRGHLKLKELRIDPLGLVPNIQATLDDPKKSLFKEGQKVQLDLEGKIQSYLTQHSVTGGRYRLEFVRPFEPQGWAKTDLKAKPISPTMFQPVSGEILEPIPPNQSRDVNAVFRSSQPISLKSPGLGTWLRLASQGAEVQYVGTVRMSFDNVQVQLERNKMEGIFGIGVAPRVFNFQDLRRLNNVLPSEASVSFTIKTKSSRTAVLLLVLAFLALLLGILTTLLMTKRWYHVRITGTPDRLIPLRRLGSYQVVHEGQTLGRLSRGISGEHTFEPSPLNASFTMAPTLQPDTYDVRFRDGRGCQLSIEPKGGRKKPAKPNQVVSGPPPPSGASQAAGPAPARPMPKIDRP